MSSFQETHELSRWQKFWQSQKNQRRVTIAFKLVLAFFVLGFSLYPVLYTVSSAFSSTQGVSRQLVPDDPTLNNFRRILF
ncbi:MAG TPA: hypothetical protein EYP41_16715, partial [Anaerolineae bacterium]|nr:hypothetical protein [Anaerolineae bacterium]